MSPDGDIIVQRQHSAICFEDSNAHSEASFKHALKDMLSRQFWKLKDLYETVVAMYPEAIKILVPFNSIVSSMKRWRRKNYPPCPKSLEEMTEQLVQPDNDRLLQYDTGRLVTKRIFDNKRNLHVLLYDPEFIRDEFQNVTRIFIDGTFQTTPRVTGVYQLVTILGVKYDHALPFAHILMSKKTECAYMAVLAEIKTIIHSASVAVVMTDFEQGLRNAARATFVNAHIAGCSVHYDRALLKKIKSLRLTQLIRDNEAAKLFVKKLMALAYLPENLVQPHYWQSKTTLTPALWRSFAGFIAYYERQWLRVVKPAGFSVFGLTHRTNNVIESYNSVLAVKLGVHPSPWTFVVKLIQLISNAKTDLQSLRLNKRIKRYPRYGTTYRQKKMINAWRQLHSNEITPAEFLEKAAALKGHISQKLANIPDELLENEVEAELEATPDNTAHGDPDYNPHMFDGLRFDDAVDEKADVLDQADNHESDLDDSASFSSIGSESQAENENETVEMEENNGTNTIDDVRPEELSTFNADLETEVEPTDERPVINSPNPDDEIFVHNDPVNDVDADNTVRVANNELLVAATSNHEPQNEGNENETVQMEANNDTITIDNFRPGELSPLNANLETQVEPTDERTVINSPNPDDEIFVRNDPVSDVDADNTVRVANNESPVAATNNHQPQNKVSASRKKNLRKKRRKLMKAQHSGVDRQVRPYGHKRRKNAGNNEQAPNA